MDRLPGITLNGMLHSKNTYDSIKIFKDVTKPQEDQKKGI